MITPASFRTLAMIGNGIIGHGVAQVFAVAGKRVRLIGRSEKSLARALDNIRSSLAQFTAHDLVSAAEAEAALARITISTQLEDAAAAELVIEAVTEDLDLKRDIFARLDRIVAPPAVLATSSGQPASVVADGVKHRERLIATHFWYPPQLIPLVEVCGTLETDADVVAWTCAALRAGGKEPVVIDREVRGFIGNRLQFAMLREAWALWASGTASAEAIDSVVRNSFGRRVAVTGPLESADLGGLDTFYHFGASLIPDLDVGQTPPDEVRRRVEAGERGLSTGRGIYDWSRRDGKALLAARMEELFRWLKTTR